MEVRDILVESTALVAVSSARGFKVFGVSSCSSLPELLEKKRLIDLHTNVATAVLDHIKVHYTVSAQTGYTVCLLYTCVYTEEHQNKCFY